MYLLFCLRIGGRYRVFIEPFADPLVLPRRRRREALELAITRYAQRLEAHCLLAPTQWFNFFDFWGQADPTEHRTKQNKTMACARACNRLESEVEVDVPFHDSDPMGVTWHGNYFRYLESARGLRCSRRIGYNYADMVASGYLWPVVEAHIKYLQPTRFGQRLAVKAWLEEYENRSEDRVRDQGLPLRRARDHGVHDASRRR